jgi:DNA polymerase (family 10)
MKTMGTAFNDALAERFHKMAALLELSGANRFKSNAYAKAARVVEALTESLEPIADDTKALTAIDGIGASIADKISEYHASGTMADLDELNGAVPAGLLALLNVQNLGPKTVRLMWTELGIESAEDVQRAIDDGTLSSLKGMGKKSVEGLKANLAFAMQGGGGRLRLGEAEPVARRLAEFVRALPGVQRAEVAGSIRRGKETSGDIDILVVADDPIAVHKAFRSMDTVLDVLASGERKSSVRVSLDDDGGRWGREDGAASVQADLRTVPAASWGAALMYFTGSKEHNTTLRGRARDRGLTLNEYGLFRLDRDADTPPQERGVEPVAGATEADVFEALGLVPVPPEMREDRGETALAAIPVLIEVDDIHAELHAHTTASDGRLELHELVDAAKARGFHTIAVTDHSRSSVIANGLSAERLREQILDVRAHNHAVEDITVLAGSEVDILVDGTLDYDDELLAELDIVVASPHASTNQDPRTATDRLLKAIAHPLVHIIGHPTSRLINRRRGLEPEMSELYAAAKEHNVALEINAHWMRLDLRDVHVRAAVEAGCLIAINCDVHEREDFDNIRYGVATARRGWLPAQQCVNAWDALRLHEWLRSKR